MCPRSAIEIVRLKQDLQKGVANSETVQRTSNAFGLILEELFARKPTGVYGAKCFMEFMEIIVTCKESADKEESDSILAMILPIHEKAISVLRNIESQLMKQKKILEKKYDLKDILVRGSKEERMELYHLLRDIYLQVYEGVFYETARVYYLLYSYSKGMKITPDGLPIWFIRDTLRDRFNHEPLFLSNLKDKETTRNAIAHASHSYDAAQDIAQFIDEIGNRKKTYSLYEFFMASQELLDTTYAFIFSLTLYIILITITFVQSLAKGKNDSN